MTALELLKMLPAVFKKDAAGNLNIVIQYAIPTPAYVTVANGVCTVSEGQGANPTATLTMADDTLIKTMTGKLNPMTAFMSGKLKAAGDLVASQKAAAVIDNAKLAALVMD